jgi:hypothetical protein
MTTEEIKRAAAEVRDERNESANTATRVGKVLVDLCEAIDAASSEAAATNGATNQLMTKYSEYLEVLKPWLVGKLREADFKDFAEFNSYMDSLRPDGPLKSGRYRAVVGGVPLFVTYVVLSVANQIAVVWVEGFFAVTNNALSINHEKGFTIASRYFGENSVWHRWKTICGDLESAMPTVQTSATGNNKNYIYSNSSDAMHLALCGKIWIYRHGTDGNMFLRFKNWGANNDEEEKAYSQVMLPNVSSSQRGLMDNDVFRRITNHTLVTANSADAVKINYTNFGGDGNKTLTIGRASSAQAGVVTSQDITYLDMLKKWEIGVLGEFKSSGDFNAFLNGLTYKGIPNGKNLKSGRYLANVGGVPIFVTFNILHDASKKSAIWAEGCFMVTSGQISVNTEMGVTIAYRTCVDATWSDWKTLDNGVKEDLEAQKARIDENKTRIQKLENFGVYNLGTVDNYDIAEKDRFVAELAEKYREFPFIIWNAPKDKNRSSLVMQWSYIERPSNPNNYIIWVYQKLFRDNGQNHYRRILINKATMRADINGSDLAWKALPLFDTTVDNRITANRDDIATNIQNISSLRSRIETLEAKVRALEAK